MNLYGIDMIEADDRVVFNFVRDGSFEPESVEAWRGALRAGYVAIDVGAYTGLFALIAAREGAISVAYEPNAKARERLIENCKRNGLSVDVRRNAVTDKHEKRQLWMKHGMSSAARLDQVKDGVSVPVDCVPLREERPVCAIKIDVEGAELAALIGAAEILRRDRPLIIAEVLKPEREEAIVAYMAGYGYKSRRADRRNIIMEFCGEPPA